MTKTYVQYNNLMIFISFLATVLIIPTAIYSPPSSADEPRRVITHQYSYIDRPHTTEEYVKDISIAYGASWILYPLTQPDVVREEGSFKKFRYNFGRLVFDKDEPFWNWFVHPISGSQLFLYYRAKGYSRTEAATLAMISSTLFEFTIEIYTEPASVQDLYQTPILGSILGLGLEKLSMYLLNTGNPINRFFGHLINPFTLLWFYEGKVQITPAFDGRGNKQLWVHVSF